MVILCGILYDTQVLLEQLLLARLTLAQDSTYHQERSKYSILLSHGDPVPGGSWTHFADTRRAYADLDEKTKEQIEDLVVVHESVSFA